MDIGGNPDSRVVLAPTRLEELKVMGGMDPLLNFWEEGTMILVNGENYPLTFIYLYAYGISGYRAFSQPETATHRSCPTSERRRKYTMGQPA
jgi:hypothetical protein